MEQQHTFKNHDDTELFYRYWPSSSPSPNQIVPTIVLLHRGHEHSGRMAHLVEELNLPDYQFFAWDARGHGQSDGERGDASSFSELAKDLQYFIRHIKKNHKVKEQDIVIIGQSVGSVIAATWVHDYVPKIRALVLGSPAFSIKLYVPFAIPGLWALQNLWGNFFIKSYVKPKLLTHDEKRRETYKTDTLITRLISARVLIYLHTTSKRIIKDAHSIHIPTQLLVSDSDYVVRKKPQRQFFDNLGSDKKEYHVLPHFYHDTLGEKDRQIAIDKARRFILECFENPVTQPSLINADQVGYTKNEAEQLMRPPKNILARAYWKTTQFFLQYISRLSHGIHLGFETGFDSGGSLDYIYRNEPAGNSFLGRIIDFFYLQSIGWRGIRQRKIHLEQLIKQAITTLKQQNKPVI